MRFENDRGETKIYTYGKMRAMRGVISGEGAPSSASQRCGAACLTNADAPRQPSSWLWTSFWGARVFIERVVLYGGAYTALCSPPLLTGGAPRDNGWGNPMLVDRVPSIQKTIKTNLSARVIR